MSWRDKTPGITSLCTLYSLLTVDCYAVYSKRQRVQRKRLAAVAVAFAVGGGRAIPKPILHINKLVTRQLLRKYTIYVYLYGERDLVIYIFIYI